MRDCNQRLVFRKQNPEAANTCLRKDTSECDQPNNSGNHSMRILKANVSNEIVGADQPSAKGYGPIRHRVSGFVACDKGSGYQQDYCRARKQNSNPMETNIQSSGGLIL